MQSELLALRGRHGEPQPVRVVVAAKQTVTFGYGRLKGDDVPVREVEHGRRHVVVGDLAHAPERPDRGRRKVWIGKVAEVLAGKLRLVFATELDVQDHRGDQAGQRGDAVQCPAGNSLPVAGVAIGVGLLGQAAFLGEHGGDSVAGGRGRLGKRRPRKEHPRLDELIRRNVVHTQAHAAVVLDRHLPVEGTVRPCPYRAAACTRWQGDVHVQAAGGNGPVLADELPVELCRVVPLLGCRGDPVFEDEGRLRVLQRKERLYKQAVALVGHGVASGHPRHGITGQLEGAVRPRHPDHRDARGTGLVQVPVHSGERPAEVERTRLCDVHRTVRLNLSVDDGRWHGVALGRSGGRQGAQQAGKEEREKEPDSARCDAAAAHAVRAALIR